MHMWKMFIYSGLEWSIRGASIDMNMGNLKIQNVECLRRLLESQTKYKNAMENLVKLIQRQNQYQQQHQHQETVAEGFTERFKVLMLVLKFFDRLFVEIHRNK
jgi:hypothetical protein